MAVPGPTYKISNKLPLQGTHCRMVTFAIEAMDEKEAAALFKKILKLHMETVNRYSTIVH